MVPGNEIEQTRRLISYRVTAGC